MAVEPKRGCGYRKVGGLYLCGSGISISCDRLPFPIEYCPVCGSGIKFTQGFTWIDWSKYAGQHDGQIIDIAMPITPQAPGVPVRTKCSDKVRPCWMCDPVEGEKYGLLWVGEASYTPQHFIKEAIEMGVSKKIAFIPKELKLGETVVLLAHKKVFYQAEGEDGQPHEYPGIFYCFKPTTIEMPIWESELNDERKEELEKRGITPISIPDGDVDHSDEKTTIALDPVTKRFSRVLLEE